MGSMSVSSCSCCKSVSCAYLVPLNSRSSLLSLVATTSEWCWMCHTYWVCTYTDWTVLRVKDMFHDSFSTHVSNAFRYKDEARVVSSLPSCTVERL